MADDTLHDEDLGLLSLLGHMELRNARPDKAAVLYAALARLRPGDAPTLLALALSWMRCEKPQRALEALDQLARAGGCGGAFHLLRAQVLSALQRNAEAQACMQAYLEVRAARSASPAATADPAGP